jgi:hypothetical protein
VVERLVVGGRRLELLAEQEHDKLSGRPLYVTLMIHLFDHQDSLRVV